MAAEIFHGRVQLCCGDSIYFLRDQPDCRYDSVVTDPPYALVSIVKRFGGANAAPAKGNDAYMRASAGFMGKQWDTGETAFSVEFWAEVLRVLKPGAHLAAFGASRGYHRLACAIEDAGFEIRDSLMWIYGTGFPKSQDQGNGFGTALKPAFEPIVLARKPLSEGTVAANVLRWGCGALNIDGCRVGVREKPKVTDPKRTSNTYGVINSPGGKLLPDARWPANVVHDGSDEVVGMFPTVKARNNNGSSIVSARSEIGAIGLRAGNECGSQFNYETDSGSAARFFYSAKADSDDRLGSKHPTVKPVDLMQWLVRLVTPPGGLVLDPFAGTGATAEACFGEGMRCMLVEREAEYQADIRRRMALLWAGPDERMRESVKARGEPIDHGPLFAWREVIP